MAAARYIGLNPVPARLVARAQDRAWSSARAHLAGRDNGLVKVAPLLDRVGRFADVAESATDHRPFAALRAAESIGRRPGSDDSQLALERLLGRSVRRRKPGGKPQGNHAEAAQMDLLPAERPAAKSGNM